MRQRLILIGLLVMILALGIGVPAYALQDESRTVGAYDITIGWRVEPAYVGVLNGPEFWVKAHDTGAPVTGLENTLHLLTHFGDQAKLLQFYPLDPGHYTADLIPTRPGDYIFHLFGQINDQAVDEQFTSADGLFASVDPQTDIEFPSLEATDETQAATPEATDEFAALQAQIDDLRAQIAQLQAGKSS